MSAEGPPGAMAAGALEVAGLRHRFAGRPPVEVLAGVDLVAPSGSFVSVVGPSGCGKSTLLRILAGLTVPDEGTARVGGTSVLGRPGQVAYMPQRDNLLPWRRVMGNATLGAEIAGTAATDARDLAAPLLARFGLAGFEDAWPAQLSGGMRQRVALLRTFLLRRPALLLDEPFGALDAITRRSMYGWLQDVWLGDGRTVVFVTHDVEEALYLSDQVVVLSSRPGQVVAVLDVDFGRPRQQTLVLEPSFVARKADLLSALAA